MDAAELVTAYPNIHHLTYPECWDCIKVRGLLSANALLDLFGDDRKQELLGQRRATRTVLDHAVHGTAVLRDNGPISMTKLAKCLDDGLTPSDWLRILNQHVFFWPTQKRLETLLAAKAYRNTEHVVITVDTALLLERHAPLVRLSPINSGATVYTAQRRGHRTFAKIEDYDFADRVKVRGKSGAIAEVAVVGGVPDLLQVATEARLVSEHSSEVIWTPMSTSAPGDMAQPKS